jgi:hypothetical protein
MDVAGSARHNGNGQRRMRDDLFGIVDAALEPERLSLATVPYTDNGDGLRILFPVAWIRPTRVIDLLILGLSAGLREHRTRTNEFGRLRLRLALDLGEVEPHRCGWAGGPLVRVARLVEAEPLRASLAADSTVDLAAIVSDPLFESVLSNGWGYVAPSCFRRVTVSVRELETQAWLLKPGAADRCRGCNRTAA